MFLGGAAGGGKTIGILLGALQLVLFPEYNAIIFRRTYGELSDADAIMTVANQWLTETPAKWSGAEHTWTFPSGATLKFSHLENEGDQFKRQGAAYQTVAYDELTHFNESMYTFVVGRMRRRNFGPQSFIPLRALSASNPGNIGHDWVRKRFIVPTNKGEQAVRVTMPDMVTGEPLTMTRFFLPSTMEDNANLDRRSFMMSLAQEPDPVRRRQLRVGDWDITPEGRFNEKNFRFYTLGRKGFYWPEGSKGELDFTEPEMCSRFLVADTAGSKKDTADWTCYAVIDYDRRKGKAFVVDVNLVRLEIDQIPDHLMAYARRMKCRRIYIEAQGPSGLAVYQKLLKRGQAPHAVYSGPKPKDDFVRIEPLQDFVRTGTILFRRDAPWWDEVRTELLMFGTEAWKSEQVKDDAVDCLAYAAVKIMGGDYSNVGDFHPYPMGGMGAGANPVIGV